MAFVTPNDAFFSTKELKTATKAAAKASSWREMEQLAAYGAGKKVYHGNEERENEINSKVEKIESVKR